jgi:nitrite reductase/ring-hydroxylating ferredoxin subunit
MPMKIVASTLTDDNFLTADILLKLGGGRVKPANIFIFRFNNHILAYVNHCMHMQKPLNCQEDTVFDRERQHLRCSMHGFVFEPETGVCLSPVCEGRRLQKVKVIEENGFIDLASKQGEIIAVHKNGVKAPTGRIRSLAL